MLIMAKYGFRVMVEGELVGTVDAAEFPTFRAARDEAHRLGRKHTGVKAPWPCLYSVVPFGSELKNHGVFNCDRRV